MLMTPSRILYILLILTISSHAFCQHFDPTNLIRAGEIESADIKFESFKYSNLFIQKYHLKPQELDLIGGWGKNDFASKNSNTDKPQIARISFIPNRLAIIFLNDNKFNFSYLIGKWKIESLNLMITIDKAISEMPDGKLHVQTINESLPGNDSFFIIWQYAPFTQGYYQNSPFDFSKYKGDYSSLFSKKKDLLRIRYLLPSTGSNIYLDCGEDLRMAEKLLCISEDSDADITYIIQWLCH